MSRNVLVTGGAGFIGSRFVRHLLDHHDDVVITNVDALTHAGVHATVDELDVDPRHRFVHGDIRETELMNDVLRGVDVVVHLAAASHVDRSVSGPTVFSATNVFGTGILLEAARAAGVERFIHVSTDEVYGSVASGAAAETASLAPSSPYSATKGGSDLLVLSYRATYDMPVVITRATNNYGPYQFPEKLIPLFTTNLIDRIPVPVYGTGQNVRDWLHVEDHCRALDVVMERGEDGEIYNVGSGVHHTNLEVTHAILAELDMGEEWIQFVEDRPGHDERYAVDTSKLCRLGWEPKRAFEEGIAETVDWYRRREDWWRPLKAILDADRHHRRFSR